MLRTILFTLQLITLFSVALSAQPFKPDASGYVSDPKFHQLIKQRGYQLVSRFDTVQAKPLKLHAGVMLRGKWINIDQYGKEIRPPEKITNNKKVMPEVIESGPGMPSERVGSEGSPDSDADSFMQVRNSDGKLGTRNRISGKQGLPEIYDALMFYDRLELVEIKKDNKTGLALTNGQVLIAPEYDHIEFPKYKATYPFPFLIVSLNGKYGLINANGIPLCEAKYDRIYNCSNCDRSGNLQLATLNKKYGLINQKGKEIAAPVYSNIQALSGSNYLLQFSFDTLGSRRYGVMDTLGQIIQPAEYDVISGVLFIRGFFRVAKDMRHVGLMDSMGKITIPAQYSGIDILNGDLAKVGVKQSTYGLLTLDGRTIIEPVYSGMQVFLDDRLVLVKQDNKMGFFDLEGREVIPVNYKQLYQLDPYFFFEKDGQFGLMTRNQEIVKTFSYTHMKPENSYFIVSKGEKEGVIDLAGKIIIPLEYERITSVRKLQNMGLVEGKSGGKNYTIDRYGNMVFE